MDQRKDYWIPVPLYCPNCGNLSEGYRNAEGKIKYECNRCKLVMVRSYKNRRQDLLELFIPQGMERIRG